MVGTRRQVLKGAAALAAGTAAGFGREHIEKLDTGFVSGKERVDMWIEKNFAFERDYLANLPTLNPDTIFPELEGEDIARHAFIYKFFTETEALAAPRNLPGKTMPPGIRQKLATIAPGIPAGENNYREGAVSESKAKSLWQLTPGIYRRLGFEPGTGPLGVSRLVNSTQAAFYKFEEAYATLSTLPWDELQARFALSERQRENFIVLCLVSSYHNGQYSVGEAVKLLVNTETYDSFKKRAGARTELDLFAVMVEKAKDSDVGYLARFGPRSAHYVFKCLAGGQYISDHSEKFGAAPAKYELDFSRVQPDLGTEVQRVATQVGVYSALGAAVGSTADLFGDYYAEKINLPVDRRTILKTMGIGGAIGVAGVWGGPPTTRAAIGAGEDLWTELKSTEEEVNLTYEIDFQAIRQGVAITQAHQQTLIYFSRGNKVGYTVNNERKEPVGPINNTEELQATLKDILDTEVSEVDLARIYETLGFTG